MDGIERTDHGYFRPSLHQWPVSQRNCLSLMAAFSCGPWPYSVYTTVSGSTGQKPDPEYGGRDWSRAVASQ